MNKARVSHHWLTNFKAARLQDSGDITMTQKPSVYIYVNYPTRWVYLLVRIHTCGDLRILWVFSLAYRDLNRSPYAWFPTRFPIIYPDYVDLIFLHTETYYERTLARLDESKNRDKVVHWEQNDGLKCFYCLLFRL